MYYWKMKNYGWICTQSKNNVGSDANSNEHDKMRYLRFWSWYGCPDNGSAMVGSVHMVSLVLQGTNSNT